jgi:hypothetical protein
MIFGGEIRVKWQQLGFRRLTQEEKNSPCVFLYKDDLPRYSNGYMVLHIAFLCNMHGLAAGLKIRLKIGLAAGFAPGFVPGYTFFYPSLHCDSGRY